MKARHETFCDACDYPIRQGEEVARLAVDRWIHACCGGGDDE